MSVVTLALPSRIAANFSASMSKALATALVVKFKGRVHVEFHLGEEGCALARWDTTTFVY